MRAPFFHIQKDQWLNLGQLLLGTFILSFGALYNEYPFLTGDSSVYITSGFDMVVPDERPIFYGFFVRFFSMGVSLWFVVFVQNFILAFLLNRMVKFLLLTESRRIALVTILLTVMFTGITWESNKIMADIFVSYALFSVILLFFEKHTSKLLQAFYVVLFFFSALTHYSHLMIFSVIVLLLFIARVFKSPELSYRKLGVLATYCVAAWLAMGFSNYLGGKGFRMTTAGHAFIMGKLSENGILQTYLDDKCGTKNYKICRYRDSLPETAWLFVWNPVSPMLKTGGWLANEKEYNTIIRGTFSEPKYLWMHFYKSIITTGIQVTQVTSGEGINRSETSENCMQAVSQKFPHEKSASMWTRQRLKELDFHKYSEWYILFFLLSTAVAGLVSFKTGIGRNFMMAYLVVVLFYLSNAFITANFANISSRLQARLFWTFGFMNILFLLHSAIRIYRNILNRFDLLKHQSKP